MVVIYNAMPIDEYITKKIVVSLESLKNLVIGASTGSKKYEIVYVKDCRKIYGTGHVRVAVYYIDETGVKRTSITVYPLYYTRFSLFVVLDSLGTVNDFDGSANECFNDLKLHILDQMSELREKKKKQKSVEQNGQKNDLWYHTKNIQ